MKEKLLFFVLFFSFIFFVSINAIPFVEIPLTFNESLVEISVFKINEKVIIRVNVSDTENDVQYVWLNLTASNGTLVLTNELMFNTLISCGENCSVWEKNYTLAGGEPAGIWVINVTANDTSGNIATNSTTFNVSKYIELTISQALIEGISFGLVNPGTVGKPALNNSGLPNGGTQYNLTLGTSSNINADFYHRINETHSSIYINESSSRTSELEGFSSNTTLSSEWKIMGNSSVNCSAIFPGNSCWVRYFIDVEQGTSSQYFERRYCFCAVYEGGGSSICGDC
ncbi:MAG: hypothetical protein QXQ69_00330 [Candidatus Aenigmatarchaeota archaeon]